MVMPKLGESVTEGTISTWLVQEGDKVQKYDPIADVMTDKVNAEIPSSYTGTIQQLVVPEGETVEVGELICYIETESIEEESEELPTAQLSEQPSTEKTSDDNSSSMRNRYSPAVLNLAQKHDIDLTDITGTGLGGRITRKDVKNHIDHIKTEPAAQNKQQSSPSLPTSPSHAGDKSYKLTGVRKAIADNMSYSKKEIPHAWMTVEVDVTDLVHYRNQIKNDFKKQEGVNLTYFSFFVHSLSKALKEYPVFNSIWNGDSVVQKQDINISIAVANDEELYVPVIKQADQLSMRGIAREIDRLALKARNNSLTSDDMADGTFTLNNTGSFGSVSSMGIINYPQVAILQVESIVKRPVIINDMFAARDIVNLSLSLDHRVLDGLICGKFLARMKELLENTNESSLSI